MSIDRGDTRRLTVTITTGTVPTDPAALTFTARPPSGPDVVYVLGTDVELVHQSAGIFYVDLLLDASGTWVYQWESTSPTQVQGGSLFVEPAPLDVIDPPLLLTLDELRLAMGTDPTDTRDDDKWQQWLTYASDLVRTYTGRNFGFPTITEERSFEYDGSSYLDIDDATAITQVAWPAPYGNAPDVILTQYQWIAKPERRGDAPVYQYLIMPPRLGDLLGSPEMGFTFNLDVFCRDHHMNYVPRRVKVTGTWGFPVVPGDVKLAMQWTLIEWISRPEGEALTAEAIEGWARSWGRQGVASAGLAIPARALDILAGYSKVPV